MRYEARVGTLLVASLVLASGARAQTGSVSGTITAKGLRTSADIVVSLEAPGLKVTPPAAPVEMDQSGMLFVPHVLPVVRGTTVRFLNSDPVGHNVFSPDAKYNLGTWPKGETRDFTFDETGAFVQLCRVHPEMEAYVVVLDTPYFATTDRRGAYQIEGVPPGTYTLVTWSDRLKEQRQSITVTAGQATAVDLTLTR